MPCFLVHVLRHAADGQQRDGQNVVGEVQQRFVGAAVKAAGLHAGQPRFCERKFHGADRHAHTEQGGVVGFSGFFQHSAGHDPHDGAGVLHPSAVGLDSSLQQRIEPCFSAQGHDKTPRLVVVRGAAEARRFKSIREVVPRQGGSVEGARAVALGGEVEKAHGRENKKGREMFAGILS